MKYLVFNKKQYIVNGTVLELDTVSTGIPSLHIIDSLTNVAIKKISSTHSILVDYQGNFGTNESILETNLVSKIDVEEYDASATPFSFGIVLESDIETEIDYRIDIEFVDGSIIKFVINQFFEELSDRLVVLLKNYNIEISEDWYYAFRETSGSFDNPDNKFINHKIQEFLMNLFTLIGVRGSYQTLFSALNYFGWNELVYFKEHWVQSSDPNTKRLTVANYEKTELRKSLTQDGFTKTGDMTMYYALDKLDEHEPYDEGGLPNYEPVSIEFAEILFKLRYLRKVINKLFIPWDVFIIDIVGEFHKIEGRQLKWWINNDKFFNQNEEQRYKDINISFTGPVNGVLPIEERRFTTRIDEVYSNSSTNLTFKDNSKSHIDQNSVIYIDKLDDELDSYKFKEPLELIKTFQRADIGVVEVKLNEPGFNQDLSFLGCYYLEVFKKDDIDAEYQLFYRSNRIYDMSEFGLIRRFGLTSIGYFLFRIVIIDQWGYSKIFSTEFSIKREDIKVDFSCYRPKFIGEDNSISLPNYSNFSNAVDTTSSLGIPVIDAIHLSKDNKLNNYPFRNSFVRRRFSSNVNDSYLKNALINRFVKYPIRNLNKLPLSEYWASYQFIALDILKKGYSISMKLFQHHRYETITFENEMQFLHDLIELSKKPNNAFSLFDFDIQPLIKREGNELRTRLEIDENDITENVLIVYSRQKSISIDDIIFKIEGSNNSIVTNDAYEHGTLYKYDSVISLFGFNLTLYATNNASKKILIERTDLPFGLYSNSIYPTFGYDPVIKINASYNSGIEVFRKFAWFGRELDLYGKTVSFFDSTDWNMTRKLKRMLGIVTNGEDEQNLDFRLRITIDGVEYVSDSEFGVPEYEISSGEHDLSFKTPPLTMEKLNQGINKNDKDFDRSIFGFPDELYDKIEVFYFDGIMNIFLIEGNTIELSNINIGHKISTDRRGSIESLYFDKSGVQHNIGSTFIAAPNTNIRMLNHDIHWEINEHFSKEKIHESSGYYLTHQCFAPGVYDVTMTIIDQLTNQKIKKTKQGCINII